MAQPRPTPINCPNCGQPFNALLEQIIDVGQDPESKNRLLSGRVNQIVCPHCGFNGTAGTPLVYHDPSKELFITYVPMELNLGQQDQEKIVGDLTQRVMKSLPEDAPKGYFLKPNTALTMQGLIDQVLEADGITREVIEEQQRKVDFIYELSEAPSEEQDQLIADNPEMVDETFFEMLNVLASAASQQGQARQSLRMMNLRSKLMETTEIGQRLKAREDAMNEANQELQALGERISRDSFVDLIVEDAHNPAKVEALGMLASPLLDYTTFQILTERANAAEGESKDNIVNAREILLEISAAVEQQQRAVVEQAAQTLLNIMQAPDIKEAVLQNANRIDNTFMNVLQANLEEARRTSNIEASGRLREIRDEVLALVQASAPPEVQFINDLLAVEDEGQAIQTLHERQDQVNGQLVALMEELAGQLRQAGNGAAADRLEVLSQEAAGLAQAS